jgi:diguanylate cyclase (GGDEF)-like protein
MLDAVSLRVSFAIVAVTLLALFYFVAYRSTRSSYAGWWCVALGLFLAGSGAYLLDGTDQQWWANPTGNVCVVAGAAGVWAGARAVAGRRVPWPAVGATLLALLVASALDDPGTNAWSGGAVFLALMTLYIGLAAFELQQAGRAAAFASGARERMYVPILRSLTVMSTGLAAFYLARLVTFLAVGQDGRAFAVYLGTEVTTLVTTVMLATVSFSMTALSYADDTVELQTRATRDGLTGLMNREEVLRLVEQRRRAGGRRALPGVVVMADLDHFKTINDRFGHAAGDFALQSFAAALRQNVGPADLGGRWGGEEFLLHLDGATVDDARALVDRVNMALRSTVPPEGTALPTVSYGLAEVRPGDDLAAAIERADAALYAAKSDGRDRVVVAAPGVGGEEPPDQRRGGSASRAGERP